MRCERCGLEFRPRNRNGVVARFCSPGCRWKAWAARTQRRTVATVKEAIVGAARARWRELRVDGSARFQQRNQARSGAVASLGREVHRGGR